MRAPGGYGKTTLLSQWLEEDPRPAVRLRVHESASDALAVAQGIVDGLGSAGLAAADVLLPDSEDEAEWRPALVPLGRALEAISVPLVVAIDDAGLLKGEAWESLLEVVIDHLPRGSTLALATRRATPRATRRLRAQDQVLELGPRELAMTVSEIADLHRNLGLETAPNDVVSVVMRTQGWPAAVYLDARSHANESRASAHAGSSAVLIDDFIRDDVIVDLSEGDLDLLMRCSILEELSGPVCDAVTASEGTWVRLVAIARNNHLIVPIDESRQRFVMHQLLRDYLEREFALGNPEGLCQAHDAASRYFEATAQLDASIRHARHAANERRFVDLVWSHCGSRLASAQSLVVARWLEGLDRARIEASCQLSLALAWVSSHQGDLDVTQQLLFRVEEHCRGTEVTQELRDSVDLLRCTLGSVPIDEIVVTMTDAAERLGNNEWATLAHYMRGVGLALNDDPDRARAAFDTSTRLAVSLSLPVMEAHSLAGSIDIALMRGEPEAATVAIERLRVLLNRIGIDRVVTAAPVLATSAQAYLFEGRLTQARAEADRALRLAAGMRQVAPWAAVMIRMRLAGLFLAVGAPAMATQLLDEAKELHGPASACPALDRGLKEVAAAIDVPISGGVLTTGALSTAEIRVLQYLPTHLTFAGIGERLFVSRNTIKSQVHSIYRKLGVNSRSEAVEQARERGLLR